MDNIRKKTSYAIRHSDSFDQTSGDGRLREISILIFDFNASRFKKNGKYKISLNIWDQNLKKCT